MGLRKYLLLKTMKLLDRAVEERDKAQREYDEFVKRHVIKIMEQEGVDETEARRRFLERVNSG